MTQNRRQSPSEEAGAELGAARFWGEVSRAGTRGGGNGGPASADNSVPRSAGHDGPEMTGSSDPGMAGEDGPDPQQDPDGGPERGRPDPAATGAGPSGGPHGSHGECLEWCPICRSTELFRNTVTPEIREQAEALQREAVQIFRAFLTAYAERTGGPGPAARGGPDADPGPGPDAPPDDGGRAQDSGPDREVTDIPLD